ncbi:alpha/beta hydrolase [Microcoleus sp. herbarium7]|uniref:alpha/beta fold hydrolase n=1 Tax=Microcoleus sp. herbarium7 TaxID=3055435 RepID=UPI002FD3F053
MAFISIRGVEHYYEWITADNSAQRGGKPVMVFLHGWAGSARYWESTARALAGDFDCLLYDMRGFGRSPLPQQPPESSYELETYAEDLAELLEALNLSRVCINAHSTGASIATLFLNLYPEKVEKAILTCSGIFEYDEKAFTTFHKFGGYVVKFRPAWLASIPFADRVFMSRFLHRALPSDARKAFLLDFLMADEAAAIGTMVTAVSKRAAVEMPAEFARLSVPTLLVAGEFDRIIPAVMGKQAASLSKKVEFVIIPNTAHFPMLEDAATYLQRIRDFLPAAA